MGYINNHLLPMDVIVITAYQALNLAAKIQKVVPEKWISTYDFNIV